MAAKLGWAIETADLFTATVAREGGPKRHLIVESLPDGGWDWSAWSADGSGRCLHGWAETAAEAMVAAERAARLLDHAPVMNLCGIQERFLNPELRRPN